MTTERERLDHREQAKSQRDSVPEQRPVAYDSEGRPLYAAPVPQQPMQSVHFTRAVDPMQPPISEETRQRHDESVARFPDLNLSPEEYVISAVRRHYIGLIVPIAVTIFIIAFVASLVISYPMMMESMGVLEPPAYGPIALIGVLFIILFAIGGYIAVWVYMSNRFFLTNESVIQEIQQSVFHRREQTVSLLNIEDASYTQRGIVQNMFNYGSIRLSTEGDETTYKFDYVEDPKRQIAILNTAVEAFKNGRPVDPNQN